MEIPTKLSILLAEDNALNRKIAELSLRQLGVKCDFAQDGQEAFEKYKEKQYQLILMDMQMPVVDGLEATELIRNFEKEQQIEHPSFIVALTANAYIEDREKCIEAGMDDFISKPFQTEDLLTVLEKSAQRSNRELAH